MLRNVQEWFENRRPRNLFALAGFAGGVIAGVGLGFAYDLAHFQSVVQASQNVDPLSLAEAGAKLLAPIGGMAVVGAIAGSVSGYKIDRYIGPPEGQHQEHFSQQELLQRSVEIQEHAQPN